MREECVAPEEGVPCFPPIHLLGEKREVFEEDLRWEDSVPKNHRGGAHERSRRKELLLSNEEPFVSLATKGDTTNDQKGGYKKDIRPLFIKRTSPSS